MAEHTKINQHQIISEIAAETGIARKDVALCYDLLIEKTKASLDAGVNVDYTRFATFEIVERKATTGRNPQTGEEVKVPAKKVVKVRTRAGLNKLTKIKEA